MSFMQKLIVTITSREKVNVCQLQTEQIKSSEKNVRNILGRFGILNSQVPCVIQAL